MTADIQYIDTHAHLNLSAFADDGKVVAEKCKAEHVAVINIGTTEATSARAVELALSYEHMYAMVGLHPIQTVPNAHDEDEIGVASRPVISKGEAFNKDYYRALIERAKGKVVGIGECGFDYYHLESNTRENQVAAFIAQIEFANELGLPLMIHTRDAKGNQASAQADAGGGNVYDDTYTILKQYAKVPFNVHFYAGTYEQAKRFFDIGGTISFTGVITFAKDYEAVVRHAPLALLHAETDCPFVAPKPYRGQRCEPWMVTEVYKKIAEIKGLNEVVVREQLLQNAKAFYRI